MRTPGQLMRLAIGRVGGEPANLDKSMILQGTVLAELHGARTSSDVQDYEFSVFSQWGEDGILQHLTSTIEIPHRSFIEFGVEDFSESNCRFLMEKDNWQGFVIDGSPENIARLRTQPIYWRRSLDAIAEFITRDNIGSLLGRSGFDHDLGILSIDLDGNDYYILEALSEWRPRILVVEYNAVFGGDRAVSVPYDPAFQRHEKHHSGLYFGASLPAFAQLAEERGYALVGVNRVGNNAFFVRTDVLEPPLVPVLPAEVFRASTFRESRDEAGELTFLSGDERRRVIGDLPLVDVATGATLLVRDLP